MNSNSQISCASGVWTLDIAAKKTSMLNIWLAKSSMGNELEFFLCLQKDALIWAKCITFWWIWDFFPCLHEPLSSFISIVISLSVRACLCVSVNNLNLNLMITGPPLCQWNTSHAPCWTIKKTHTLTHAPEIIKIKYKPTLRLEVRAMNHSCIVINFFPHFIDKLNKTEIN